MDYSYLKSEQPVVYQTLKNMIEKGHIPHAFVFYGDKNTSKKEMATLFIKMVYADSLNLEIDSAPIFKRIDDDSCTNINWIKKDKKTAISIESVQGYIRESNVTALEEGPKFFIFEEGDSLNTSSSNAILKFTEEPVDNVFIIFLVENLSSLLDTILSRCIILNFKPLNKDAIINKLAQKKYDKVLLNIISEYTLKENEIEEIIADEDYMKVYSLISDMFIEKFERSGSIILYINENYKLITKSPELTDFFLSLLILYMMDIFNTMFSKAYEPLFIESKERIGKISVLYKRAEFSEYIKELLNIKSNINSGRSINLHLYLDNLFLKMEIAARK